MDTVRIGNELEQAIYEFLIEQQERGQLLLDTQAPQVCSVHWKPKYYCKERQDYVEFDVSIEIRRKPELEPQEIIVLECKNYSGSVPETEITDFSDKLSRIGRHNTKGFIVVSSALQRGAEKLAKSRKIGIVKFDEHGLEFIAERRLRENFNTKFTRTSLFEKNYQTKKLKFAATFMGRYYDNPRAFLRELVGISTEDPETEKPPSSRITYISNDQIEAFANTLLQSIGYFDGPVDLYEVCQYLGLALTDKGDSAPNVDGYEILGKADFANNAISIYDSGNLQRERFTLAHEIGHFQLQHAKFLSSETTIKQDLMISNPGSKGNPIDRMEYQANLFASHLLLPKVVLLLKIKELKTEFGIRDKGHGYIFVDDQPHNQVDYFKLIYALSDFFDVSSTAVQIRLKGLDLIVDERGKHSNFVSAFTPSWLR
ncbi:ImmA/IrrE family metallo-endopeptidase [Thalassospira sp.]|uniref:ImmA/IrrE family metallo-endopeptidase n=1 Tax=Thalassospira sp. TaxID=1912094 RepID=UPI0032F051CD